MATLQLTVTQSCVVIHLGLMTTFLSLSGQLLFFFSLWKGPDLQLREPRSNQNMSVTTIHVIFFVLSPSSN
jgi:hypothetical protein